jgi:hypothetical protein
MYLDLGDNKNIPKLTYAQLADMLVEYQKRIDLSRTNIIRWDEV